jgi:hypothetical protein
MGCKLANEKKREPTAVIEKAKQLFYKQIAEGLSKEEKQAINNRALEELGESKALGKEIKQAVLTYVCPETGALVNTNSFSAHGNINPQTNDTEAIVTINCRSCGKEHPIMGISFSEMFSMPFIDE